MNRVLALVLLLAATTAVRADDPAPITALPEGLELVRNVVYGTAPGRGEKSVDLTLHAVFPRERAERLPVIVYFHGGGYFSGSKEQGIPASVGMASGGYFAVTAGYRLAGTASFPAQIEDGKAVIRFLREHHEQLHIDPKRIGVWGHSAGGHLAAMLAVTEGVAALEGGGATDISLAVTCAVPISGFSDVLDFSPDEPPRMLRPWLRVEGEAYPPMARLASPITHVDAADPPMFILHGEDDRIVPVRQAELLQEALQAAGVEHEFVRVPGHGHLITDPRAYRQAAAFLDARLGGAGAEQMMQLPALVRAWQRGAFNAAPAN